MPETLALEKTYAPQDVEQAIYRKWLDAGCFRATPGDPAEPREKRFTIVIPPPNVTGALHLGHALNNTLQDILVRWHRMMGHNTLWLPGTDHAGIATQAVVESRLFKTEGKTRHDLGRDALVQRIWNWKDQYEKRILSQLQLIGCSCDWDRTRFTLDDGLSRAVRHTFFRFFKDGLIFRGKRLVNWDTQLQTAVADDEVYHETVKGHFWHFRYPVNDPRPGEPDHVVIATTRPETMLGDTAVAVHPDPEAALDRTEAELRERLAKAPAREKPALRQQLENLAERRHSHLPRLIKLRDMARDGRTLTLPLVNREIPLVTDEWADPLLGSGCVKITPAHDHNDYEVAQRCNLPMISMMNPDGTINANGGPYQGLTMLDGRRRVVADLEAAGLLEAVEDRETEIGHSDRSKTPIEPFLSDQWFVKMGDLAQAAMDAVTDGRVRFFPERYAKSYLDWLGEKRDWCISRQLWWGHRIPVWTVTILSGVTVDNETTDRLNGSARKGASDQSRDRKGVGDSHEPWCDTAHVDLGVPRDKAKSQLRAYFNACDVPECDLVIRVQPEAWWKLEICPGSDRAEAALRAFIQYEKSSRIEKIGPGEMPKLALATVPGFERATHAANGVDVPLDIHQDPDVLDTWFSSALWPYSTLGWPDETDDLKYYYPGSVLITSRDIITNWVARMVLTGLYNLNEVPFDHVYIHTKILDGRGETMSKSKGNGVDPLDVVEVYGADALRYTMADMATETQDVRMPVEYICPHCRHLIPQASVVPHGKQPADVHTVTCQNQDCKKKFATQWAPDALKAELPVARETSDKFEIGRNFCNKLWNSVRFACMNLEGAPCDPLDVQTLPPEDRWILAHLSETIRTVHAELADYHYSTTVKVLRDFFWESFCDWYIELTKPRFRDPAAAPVAKQVLAFVTDQTLRLFSPLLPFVTERLWEALSAVAPKRGLPGAADLDTGPILMLAAYPPEHGYPAFDDSRTLEAFEDIQAAVRGIRDLRNKCNVPNKDRVTVTIKAAQHHLDLLAEYQHILEEMAGVANLSLVEEADRPKNAGTTIVGPLQVFVHDISDDQAERRRLHKELESVQKRLQASQAKLANENFVTNAKPEIVQAERDRQSELQKQKAAVQESLNALIADSC